MSEARDRHHLVRGLARMTVEAVEARQQREAELSRLGGGEVVQQVQVNVSGKVGASVTAQEIDVSVPMPFLNDVSPDQTTSTPAPHFASGVEMATAGAVILHAQLRRWIRDESSFITGARIRLVAHAPGAPRLRHYAAVVHLSFFGYAAPMEDDTEG